MPFNSLLLSLFASKTRFRGDVASMALRFQVLSIIYINFCVYGIVSGYELATYWTVTPHLFPLTSALTPLVAFSLWSLRSEKYDLAATIVVIHMHVINYGASAITKVPMASISCLLLSPTLAFFLGSALVPRILNMVLCMIQVTFHIMRIQEIFKVTLTDEQYVQIHTFLVVTFLNMAFACFTTFVQKSLEMNLWKMVQESYEKSEKLTKEVVQAAEAKDKFVSSLSHEIRNPLNALKGSIDYLLTVIKGQNYIQVLESAKMSSDVLINLANNVLDAAKLRSEKMDISYTESIFGDTVKKVLTINSENLKAKKIAAKAYIDNVLSEKLWIDPSRLLQILMNLVSNALKFTPQGGKVEIRASWFNKDCDKEMLLEPSNDKGSGTIQSLGHLRGSLGRENEISARLEETVRNTLGSFEDLSYEEFDPTESENRLKNFKLIKKNTLKSKNSLGNILQTKEPWSMKYFTSSTERIDTIDKKGYLKVEVSDTGCGIAPENIPKLFEMFVQAHKSVNTMHGGTGLGLWICKQLCQKMGGDIKLYSELNKGTTFVFYIPVDNDRQDRAISLNQGQVRESVNVMVVDDYAHNRDLHRLLLEREGAKVVMACNGREAVEKYKQYEEGYFDFIMMDVLMPEIDGFEAARMIKKWEMDMNRKKKVDICFVSGEYYNEEEVMSAFKHIGGKEVVTGIKCLKKPVDIEMIRKVVDEYKWKSN